MRKFKELAPSRMHFSMFKEFTDKFFRQRQLHESISIFRQLGSKDQEDLIEKMFNDLMQKVGSHQYMNQGTTSSVDIQDEYDEDDPIVLYMGGVEIIQDIIVEKLPDESEENFRLRRFITMCSKHPILCKTLVRTEAGKCDRKGTLLHSSNNEEIEEIKEYRYAEFYLGLSIIWFKTRCANISRNPIQVLFGEVEADRPIEKLPDESEEDFKLRRFTESFKQLPFSSQEKLVKYIRKTLSYDIGEKFGHDSPSGYAEIQSAQF
ncbi:hypothetical protein M0R45_037109 [Rubus argutus]|uniref:Uncharacterized protein n=1 Tax=Rubus argutus TaxID=59490 RepID=A0AAW1W1J2_RUBAR